MLRRAILLAFVLLGAAVWHRPSACAPPAQPAPPLTLRLDYLHTGNATEEHFALDGLALERPWAGQPAHAIDDTNLGKYSFEVIDLKTKHTIYSRGFASIYGEWETTGEAKQLSRGFSESLRFPLPEGPARVVIKKRDARNLFHEVWSVTVDPADPNIDRSPPPSQVDVWPVMYNGQPRDKVDLLLMGDGYTKIEMGKWRNDARRLTEILFSVSPFRERRPDFNVWAIDFPAEQDGVTQPQDGIYRRSPLLAAYGAFGSERYILTFANKRMREAAAAANYDFVEIVTNSRKYGGGGIFNLYATVAADNAWTPYVFVHEFGHHFAGLADEYYTSDVAYEGSTARPEPWEPNVTADPLAAKWKGLITPGTPLPAPWPKQQFEALQKQIQERRRQLRAQKRPEEEMEALFKKEQEEIDGLLATGPYPHNVGAFEGAMYEARGYYRPQQDCIMFTRSLRFCAVCRRAIERVIDLYTK